MNNSNQEKNSKLFFLLDKIKKQGYSNSINELINKYPEMGYRFDKKQGSVFLRSINGNNTKCLVINSDLGNIPEFLSAIFEKVISIDTEEKILNGFQDNYYHQTNIIIAHRISSVKHADQIFVLLNGEITEQGTHDELIKKKGFYSELYQQQLLEEALEEI